MVRCALAVALVTAVGHVRRNIEPELAQRQHQDRQPGQPVGVEVAEDHRLLAGRDGALDAGPEGGRVGQHARVVQAAARLVEECRPGRWIGVTAAGEDAHQALGEAARAPRRRARKKA